MIAKRGKCQSVGDEEYGCGYGHRQEHGACGGGADEHAVPCEGEESGDGYRYYLVDVLVSMHDDILFGAQEIEKQVTAHGVDDGEGHGESGSPSAQRIDASAQ